MNVRESTQGHAGQEAHLIISPEGEMAPEQVKEAMQRFMQAWSQRHPGTSGQFAIVVTDAQDGAKRYITEMREDGTIAAKEPIRPDPKAMGREKTEELKLPWYLDFDNRKSPFDNFLEKLAKGYHEAIRRVEIVPEQALREEIRQAKEQAESMETVDAEYLRERGADLDTPRIDPKRIDWEKLAGIGISQQALREDPQAFERLLRGEYSAVKRFSLQPPEGVSLGSPVEFEARLRLEQTPQGVKIYLLPVRKECSMQQESMVNLTPEQRQELADRGVASGRDAGGQQAQFIVDADTKQIVHVPISDTRALIERQAWANTLSENQIRALSEGKWVEVKGMPDPRPHVKQQRNGYIHVDMLQKTVRFSVTQPEQLRRDIRERVREQKATQRAETMRSEKGGPKQSIKR